MFYLKIACETSTAHGIPRIVTGDKPIFMRLVWLFLFLLFMALFIKDMLGLINKLQNPQVRSSIEASSVRFRYPDIYACFENPVAATYAAKMDAETAASLEAKLTALANWVASCMNRSGPIEQTKLQYSFFYPPSMPYQLLVDALAHRAEQSVISSLLAYTDTYGFPTFEHANFTSFYHPNYLRCFRWRLGASVEDKLLRSGTSAGLVLTLMLDGNDTAVVPVDGRTVNSRVYTEYKNASGVPSTASSNPVFYYTPLSELSLKLQDFNTSADRRVGVRLFLAPPGEYPTDFARSYLLAPGQYHIIDAAMTVQSYASDQFPCLENPENVQFFNPYEQTPYTHEYSYSYCYYHEYHKQYQTILNLSGPISPLSWPLRSVRSVMNLTGEPNFFDPICGANKTTSNITTAMRRPESYDEPARKACLGQDRCSLLVYDATISSADWPTPTSLNAYLGTTVATARASAATRGLATPVLDFLVNNPRSNVTAAYVRSNLVKIQIRPSRMMCDRLVFAYTYGFENFIADVGGIMGIYLGMSLLTVFELLDLIVDLIRFKATSSKSSDLKHDTDSRSRLSSAKVNPMATSEMAARVLQKD